MNPASQAITLEDTLEILGHSSIRRIVGPCFVYVINAHRMWPFGYRSLQPIRYYSIEICPCKRAVLRLFIQNISSIAYLKHLACRYNPFRDS